MRIEGLDEFIKKMNDAANGGLKEEYKLWLEASGMEFLDLIQDEIIRSETVDTRRLLNSFGRGDSENLWSLQKGGLSLEIGTNVEYASYVNDGHFTVDINSGKDRRWVPGQWVGDRFQYDPTSKTGMLLTVKWIDGTGYWDVAFAMFEKMFQKSMDRRLQEWLNTHF